MTQESAASVLEFGPASGPPDAPKLRRRQGFSRWLTGARLDSRVVPILAGLGAVAAFASLVTRWQETRIGVELDEGFIESGNPKVVADLTDIGTWSFGYLMGLFALAACVALVLSGAPEVRRHARLAGLGSTVALLALLVAAGIDMGRTAVGIPPYAYLGETRVQFDNSYGPGLYLAFAGVAAVGAALYLAGRLPAAVKPGHAPTAEADEKTEDLSRWRRQPAAGADNHDEPPPPADLTVQPTSPFIQIPDR